MALVVGKPTYPHACTCNQYAYPLILYIATEVKRLSVVSDTEVQKLRYEQRQAKSCLRAYTNVKDLDQSMKPQLAGDDIPPLFLTMSNLMLMSNDCSAVAFRMFFITD